VLAEDAMSERLLFAALFSFCNFFIFDVKAVIWEFKRRTVISRQEIAVS
jgi:hypothetical protein